jgi:hypothetical protein
MTQDEAFLQAIWENSDGLRVAILAVHPPLPNPPGQGHVAKW